MKKYLRHYEKQNGFKQISNIGDGDLALTEFGILNLDNGTEFCENTGANEIVLIILGGKCSIQGASFEFAEIGERKNVFSGKPYTVMIPCDNEYKITALDDVEIARIKSPSDIKMKPFIIMPDDVKEVHLGNENYQRDAYLILTDAHESKHLFIGEAFVPSGNHASFPPHRHDFDNLPDEVDMEEIYFFRFDPAQGYGIQKIYTDNRSIDETYTVQNNDTTLLPEGYHPVINAPGYTMYYLWIMAGPNNRKFLSVIDPDHKWIVKS